MRPDHARLHRSDTVRERSRLKRSNHFKRYKRSSIYEFSERLLTVCTVNNLN